MSEPSPESVHLLVKLIAAQHRNPRGGTRISRGEAAVLVDCLLRLAKFEQEAA